MAEADGRAIEPEHQDWLDDLQPLLGRPGRIVIVGGRPANGVYPFMAWVRPDDLAVLLRRRRHDKSRIGVLPEPVHADPPEIGAPEMRKAEVAWAMERSRDPQHTTPALQILRNEVERLRAGLDRLARLGNEPHQGNSVGNQIAQEVLDG